MAALRSIGAKLTLWYTALLTFTLLILGSLTFALMAYSLARDVDYALSGVADVLAENALNRNRFFIPAEVDELFRRFFGVSPSDGQIDIFDPFGRLQHHSDRHSFDIPLSQTAMKRAAQGLSTYETVELPDAYPARILTAPVMNSGRVVNLVRVGMSLENMHQTRQKFLLIMAAVFPFSLLLSGGGGWLLARRALKPVDEMTRTARRISGENIGRRLQESGNGDELDRLARTLNDMLGRLDTMINQMRSFSADASHELQTPLTILQGEMEVALLKQRTPEEYEDVLRSGLEEIGRINHLVEGLLLLARADAGVLGLDFRRVDLSGLVRSVCDRLQPVAGSHSVTLTNEAGEPLPVNGDEEHLHRLVRNIVDNGIKYTPPGGSVRVSTSAEDGWAAVRIADTGIGLSSEEQDKIFNRFHRSAEARNRSIRGVGLGLSIAHSIAAAHGGSIAVSSTVGGGSTFTVRLPLADEAASTPS